MLENTLKLINNYKLSAILAFYTPELIIFTGLEAEIATTKQYRHQEELEGHCTVAFLAKAITYPLFSDSKCKKEANSRSNIIIQYG